MSNRKKIHLSNVKFNKTITLTNNLNLNIVSHKSYTLNNLKLFLRSNQIKFQMNLHFVSHN